MSLPLADALRQCHSHAEHLQSAIRDIPTPISEALLDEALPSVIRVLTPTKPTGKRRHCMLL